MSHKNLLSRSRRQPYSRSSSACTREYSSSPSVEPPAWAPRSSAISLTLGSFSATLSQQSTRSVTKPADLFSTLLFDRETAYRGGAPSSTPDNLGPLGSAPQHQDTGNNNTSYNHNLTSFAATTVQELAHPATNSDWSFSNLGAKEESVSSSEDMTATLELKEKAQYKTTVSKKKAKPPAKPAKKKKVVAESGGKAVSQGVAVVRKRTASKSASGPERPAKAAKTEKGSRANIGRKVNSKDSNKTPDKKTAPEIIEISDSEYDEKSGTRDMLRHARAAQTWEWPASLPIKQDDSEEPTAARPRGPSNPVVDEVHELRKELETERDKNKSLQADLEKSKATSRLEQEKTETKYEDDIAKLTRDLDSEKKRVETVIQQREELCAQQQLHRQESAKYTNLKIGYDALKVKHDEEQSAHEGILEDVLKDNETTKSQVIALQATNARLTNEVHMLKAAAVPKFVPPPSPAPSSAFSLSSDEERREENVRKMYLKTKIRFNELTAATKELIDCSKGMDLSSFGDFGRCVKRMKVAVEPQDEVTARSIGGGGIRKADDEDGWGSSQGSKRSRL